MTSREIVKVFQELFPAIVIEKWLPGGPKQPGGKRNMQMIRVIDSNHRNYIFDYHTRNDWTLKCCFLPIKD